MNIGNKIYELRTAKNLSQGELAEMLDVSRQSVSKWETDTAVPELDKLIKLCDVFGVTLDELAERSPQKEAEATVTVIEKHATFPPQHAIGCILLTISLISGILLFLLSDNHEDMFVLFPVLLSIFVCGVICLCLKNNVGYWCTWVALAPVTILTPHIVGLPILSGIGGAQIIIFAALGIFAAKKFKGNFITANKLKTIALICCWIVCAAAYAVTLFVIPFEYIPMIIINFVIYAAFAVLITYTGIYAQSAKPNNGN